MTADATPLHPVPEPSVLEMVGRCAACWDERMGCLPDFVVVPRERAAALRLELREVLGCEPPSVHDMVKDAAEGLLVPGGSELRLYFGSQWACGMDLPPAVLEAVELARADAEPPHAGLILPPGVH